MKISGSGPALPRDGAPAAEEAKGPSGKGFAEAVDRTGSPSAAAAPSEAARLGPVADIVADLRAGKISPEVALDRVVDRVLTLKVGPDAPPAVREQVGAALRQALEDDPLLADKLRALGE
jgi:hypothetical protein